VISPPSHVASWSSTRVLPGRDLPPAEALLALQLDRGTALKGTPPSARLLRNWLGMAPNILSDMAPVQRASTPALRPVARRVSNAAGLAAGLGPAGQSDSLYWRLLVLLRLTLGHGNITGVYSTAYSTVYRIYRIPQTSLISVVLDSTTCLGKSKKFTDIHRVVSLRNWGGGARYTAGTPIGKGFLICYAFTW